MTTRPSPQTITAPHESLTATDDMEHDVPAQRPAIALPVDTVQIVNQRIPFTLQDRLFGQTDVLCDLVVGCDLPADQRGIHMSRIEQALDVRADQAVTLPHIALLIAGRVARTQERPGAHAHLSGELVLRNRTTVTDLTSRDRITLTAKAVLGSQPTLALGLSATNMTACPCMQAYALDDLIAHFTDPDSVNGADAGDPVAAAQAVRAAVRAAVPVATHSQKGRVSITIEIPLDTHDTRASDQKMDQFRPWLDQTSAHGWTSTAAGQLPTVTDLYRILQDGSTLTSELLKRPDEYDMVKRAHRRAQFVEDVARETALAAASRLQDLRPDAVVSVHASSYESIHGHDIEALLTSSLSNLRIQQNPGSESV